MLLYVHRAVRTIKDGEPRMLASTLTRLLSFEVEQQASMSDVDFRCLEAIFVILLKTRMNKIIAKQTLVVY